MAAAGRAGAYNAIAQPGSATWGELLETAREVTGGGAELRWVDPAFVEAHVEEPWEALPLWPIPSLPGLYGSRARAAAAGLAPRPLRATIEDTWAWLAAGGELDDWRASCARPGSRPRRSASCSERREELALARLEEVRDRLVLDQPREVLVAMCASYAASSSYCS